MVVLLLTQGWAKVYFNFTWGGLLAIGPEWRKGIAYLPEGTEKEGVIVQNLDKPGKFPPGPRTYGR